MFFSLVWLFAFAGYLDGIKRKETPIVKLQHVDFAYPNTDRIVLKDVTVKCSLSSRVAVVGVSAFRLSYVGVGGWVRGVKRCVSDGFSLSQPPDQRELLPQCMPLCSTHWSSVQANGAGKSTLIKLIMGESEATSGTVCLQLPFYQQLEAAQLPDCP